MLDPKVANVRSVVVAPGTAARTFAMRPVSRARAPRHAGCRFLERLAEVLHGPDPEAALNQFWKAVDPAFGKPTEHLEVHAGPIPPEELATWSDEKMAERLAELEAMSGPV